MIVPILLGWSGLAHAQAATEAGKPTSEHPTFHNLSLAWPIEGDDNQNGVVTVRYRAAGELSYREALPLFRVPADQTAEGFTWSNRHVGSVFSLEPGTAYEIELRLVDPDGGNVTEQLRVTTRALPSGPANPTRVEATPDSITSLLESSAPGTVLVLADGTYGELVVPNDGTAQDPIVLSPLNKGGAVVAGDVRLDGRAFVHVEGLTIQGKVKLNAARDLLIRGCTIETMEDGIVARGSGATDVAILHNTVQGVTRWAEAALGVDGDKIGRAHV